MNSVEMCELDLKYEEFRLQDKYREGRLLASISETGIKESTVCITPEHERPILLDGFKRYRAAKKLGLNTLPFKSISTEEAMGVLELLRISNAKSLNILEQARFVDQLKNVHKLSVREIAERVQRSVGWVSVRLGLLSEMSPTVLQEVFSGNFPVRSYMYTLHQITRVNKIPKSEMDDFVRSVSGNGLSTRSIERLANVFFRGNDELKNQILHGNFKWTLDQMGRDEAAESPTLTRQELRFIRDLEIVQKYMSRIMFGVDDHQLSSMEFMSQANLLIGGILSKNQLFIKRLEVFYARSGAPEGNLPI